jgi:hypothetical protein
VASAGKGAAPRVRTGTTGGRCLKARPWSSCFARQKLYMCSTSFLQTRKTREALAGVSSSFRPPYLLVCLAQLLLHASDLFLQLPLHCYPGQGVQQGHHLR